MGFCFTPAGFINTIVSEKKLRIKQQQVISGINIFVYWAANFIWDVFTMLIPIGNLFFVLSCCHDLLDTHFLKELWGIMLYSHQIEEKMVFGKLLQKFQKYTKIFQCHFCLFFLKNLCLSHYVFTVPCLASENFGYSRRTAAASIS